MKRRWHFSFNVRHRLDLRSSRNKTTIARCNGKIVAAAAPAPIPLLPETVFSDKARRALCSSRSPAKPRTWYARPRGRAVRTDYSRTWTRYLQARRVMMMMIIIRVYFLEFYQMDNCVIARFFFFFDVIYLSDLFFIVAHASSERKNYRGKRG